MSDGDLRFGVLSTATNNFLAFHQTREEAEAALAKWLRIGGPDMDPEIVEFTEDSMPRSEVRVQIGGFCLKGGCHIWTYEDGPDGCSGWPAYIEVDPEDVHMFPEWVQERYRYATGSESAGPA